MYRDYKYKDIAKIRNLFEKMSTFAIDFTESRT